MGRDFFVIASSLDDASSRSFSKRRALSEVDASNRTRRVVSAEAAAIISIYFIVGLKFRLADLRARDRVRPLELEVGVRSFLPQRSSCACPARRWTPRACRPRCRRRSRRRWPPCPPGSRGAQGAGPAAHLRQRSDEARVDGRHRACVARRVDGVFSGGACGAVCGFGVSSPAGRSALLVLWASRVLVKKGSPDAAPAPYAAASKASLQKSASWP